MSKTTFSLVVAFIAGCGAAVVTPLMIPPAHAQTTAQWETYCVYYNDGSAEDTAAWLTSTGNTAGRQGWEPYCVEYSRCTAAARSCASSAQRLDL